MKIRILAFIGLASCVALSGVSAFSAVELSGEQRVWHKITLTFDGPPTSEQANPNPFLDYRLDVTFSQGDSVYVVPGYYAADGDAANSSADSGNKWRVHFAPDSEGEWTWSASFKKGENVAVSENPHAAESAGYFDGTEGSFDVKPTDKSGRDLRGKGRLQYIGERYLKWAGTGEYFLKAGADAPENLLAYRDFDGDFKNDGHKDNFVKDWEPHVKDWRDGDPVWQVNKGKGLIGAINYLASTGMNVFSFLPMNIAGDDRNVFPYTDYTERVRMDVSKLDQWEIVFEHGTRMGMYLHFKTQEAENQELLDGGDLGVERKLYYRELIARFGHHLALNWNLGEENGKWGNHEGQTTAQRKAMAQYFHDNDPYGHLIVIHNGQSFDDLLGDSKLTGASVQTNRADFGNVHRAVLNWINKSKAAGKQWVVACDEPGDASHALVTDEEDPTRENARENALWGVFMAGGAGIEWYFGYQHPHSDLTCEDWRTRENMWRQSKIALDFFDDNEIPYWEMQNGNELTENDNDYCFYKADTLYLVYLKGEGETSLDLGEGRYSVKWFNPREGGALQSGSVASVEGPGTVDFGNPPADPSLDWLAVVSAETTGI